MKVLFIGGPLDGERKEIALPIEVYNYIPPQPMKSTPETDLTKMIYSPERYFLRSLRFGFHVKDERYESLAYYFHHESLTEYGAVKMLFDKYPEKQ